MIKSIFKTAAILLTSLALNTTLALNTAFAQSEETILSLSVDVKGFDNAQTSIITPIKVIQTNTGQTNAIILQPQKLDINFVDIQEDGYGGLVLKLKSKYLVERKDVLTTIRLRSAQDSYLHVAGTTEVEKVSVQSYTTNSQKIELPTVETASLPLSLRLGQEKLTDTQVLTFDPTDLKQEVKVTVTLSKLL